MGSTRRTVPAAAVAVLSLVLLGVSPCSPQYAASRNCTQLSMTVTAGGPAVALPSCPPFTDAMEVTFQEQITFTSVPSDLRTTINGGVRSNTILVSAVASAVPGTEMLRIHTEPRGRGLHQLAHDYAVAVTIVAPPCTTCVSRYFVGGTVSGLSGRLGLQDNGADDLAVDHDGNFFFATRLPSGAAYSASVSVQPTGQSCSIFDASGTVVASNVTSISVTCVDVVPHYTVGGTVQGLTGMGLDLTLLTVDAVSDVFLDAPASFTFPAELADGTSFQVIVSHQPTGPDQTCTVANDTGTVSGAAVTDVLVSCGSLQPPPPPPPPPPGASVSVSANPLVTPTGGTTVVSASVSGGVGPFEYEWRGYRDDGAEFSNTMSNLCAAQPSVSLTFPGSDFYIFVTVSNCGDQGTGAQPKGSGPCGLCAGKRSGGYVRVHEADEAVARFTVSPGVIHAGVDAVHFDANASTGLVTPIGWTLQYLGDAFGQFPANLPARPVDIEGWLRLQLDSRGTLFWTTLEFTTSDFLVLDEPASTFAHPGAYRMLLQVNGEISTHQTYEYFWVDP